MTVQRRTRRVALCVLTALLSICSLLCTSVTPTAAVEATAKFTAKITLMATVIIVPPTQVRDGLIFGPKDSQKDIMLAMLRGYGAAQTGNNPADAVYVNYPQVVPLLDQVLPGPYNVGVDKSRSIGATNLATAINATHGPIAVVSYSQGASVVARLLDWQKQGLVTLPDPSMLTFVNIGDPNRPNGGGAERFSGLYLLGFDWTFDGATPSDTPYTVIEVTLKYDGFGDIPKYVLNPLADINALMGMVFVHPFYDRVDMNDPANTVTHYGNTTDVLAPTSILPIMQPFYVPMHLLGIRDTRVLDALSLPLTVIIESAYDRTTAAPTPADWSNPLQNLDMTALKQSLVQAVQVLRTGKSAQSKTVFPAAPELVSDAWKVATSSTSLANFMQSMTPVAEKVLYGTPKTAPASTAPASPAVAAPMLPKLPKLPSLGVSSLRPTKPGWKPGDGLKLATSKLHDLTHGLVTPGSKPGKPSKVGMPALSKPHGKPSVSSTSGDNQGKHGSRRHK